MHRFNRIIIVLLLLIVLALYIGRSLYKKETQAESSLVSRGKELALTSGCFACHGNSPEDDRGNFRLAKSGPWRKKSIPTIWEDGISDPSIFTKWIQDGVVEKQLEKHKQFLIQMPAYGKEGILNTEEIEAIVSWIMAEKIRLTTGSMNAAMASPSTGRLDFTEDELIVAGDRLARINACYQCHGEIGQGGIQNPKSFKGYIPGFYGNEFLELTDNGSREELLHWINKGHGIDIESGIKGKLAKVYFEAQALDMPAYEDVLNDNEKSVLVDYMLLLNKRGPMDSIQLQAFSDTLENTSLAAE